MSSIMEEMHFFPKPGRKGNKHGTVKIRALTDIVSSRQTVVEIGGKVVLRQKDRSKYNPKDCAKACKR